MEQYWLKLQLLVTGYLLLVITARGNWQLATGNQQLTTSNKQPATSIQHQG